VAIVPLAYEGPPEKAYLKDALPAVLAGALRSAASLNVVPFPSSRTFTPEDDIRTVAEQLAVGSVVGGHLKVQGEQGEAFFAASTRADGGQTWSRTIQGNAESLIAQTDKLADELASALGHPARAMRLGGSANSRALEQYVRGRAFLEGWDVDQSYDRAEEAFRKAIELDSRFAEAHAMLALALWTHYQNTQEAPVVQMAVDAADRGVALAPSLPETQLAVGVVALARGRSAEAAEAFRQVQALAPADDAICRQIGDSYAALGRDVDAERMYEHAIALRPAYWENYYYQGSFFQRRGDLERAKAPLRRVIELRPGSSLGYTKLAGVHIYAGEMKEAEPLLQAALKIQPSAAAHNNLGIVYYALGRFDEAASEFRAAIELQENAARWGNLGDAYRQLGRQDDARSAYARAITLGEERLRVNPNDGATRAAHAMRLAGARRCPEARRDAARGAQDGDKVPIAQFYAAVAYAVCGDREAAVRHSVRAVEGGVVAELRSNPDLKPLLGDPRLRDRLASVHVP
jgi:tetratricopeptide (TPR) repeat protein